jgi:RNA polymerase sigma factor (sigma-70 family)
MTDAEIINYLKNGNYSKSVNGLYGLLPTVQKYIKDNNGSSDDAQDIFQDALVVLYKKVESGEFVLTVTLKTYLMAVVKNCWLQELRKRKKLPEGELKSDMGDFVLEDEPGYNHASEAFNLLAEKCKQLLIMFYFKKKNFKEIANYFSYSNETVAKNQKYRCIEKAKENYLTLSKTDTHGK